MAAGSAEVILAAVDSILKYAGAPISACKQCCRQSEMRTAGERCFRSLITSPLRRGVRSLSLRPPRNGWPQRAGGDRPRNSNSASLLF